MKHFKTLLLFIYITVNLNTQTHAQTQFQRIINPTGSGAVVYGLTKSKDNGFYVGGYNNVLGGANRNQYITKVDSIGQPIWSKEIVIGGTTNDAVGAIAPTPDSGCFVGGYNYSSLGYLHKFDKNGNLIFSKSYPGYPRYLMPISTGGYLLSGAYNSSSGYGYFAKIDDSGTILWNKYFAIGGGDFNKSIECSDGGFMIVGFIPDQLVVGYVSVVMIKTDANGNIVWKKVFGGSNSYLMTYEGGVVQTADNGFIVGARRGTTTYPVLFKVDNLGNLIWSKTYNGTMYIHDIGLENDNNLLLTSYTTVSGVGAFFIKIDQSNGNVLDTKKFDSGTHYECSSTLKLDKINDSTFIFAGDIVTAPGTGGVDGFVIGTYSENAGLSCNSVTSTITPTTITFTSANLGSPSTTLLSTSNITLTTANYTPTVNTLCYIAPLSASVSQVNTSCNGQCNGSAMVTPIGGQSPFTYLWSNGQTDSVATGLCAGFYSVTITDQLGGTHSSSVTITQPSTLVVTASASPSSICEGSCTNLTINATGGTPAYSYSWSPGGSTVSTVNVCPTSTTTYTCSISDANGCTSTATQTIVVNPLPTISYLQNPDTVCIYNSSFVLSTGTPTGGTYSGSGVTGTTFDPNVAGMGTHAIIYSYTDANSCTNTSSQSIWVDLCTEIIENTITDFNIYPNPSIGKITIESNQNIKLIEIYNVIGEKVLSNSPNTLKASVDLSEVANGIYLIKINNEFSTKIQKTINK